MTILIIRDLPGVADLRFDLLLRRYGYDGIEGEQQRRLPTQSAAVAARLKRWMAQA